jgi:tRNA(Ile)-lysidine synthase
MNSRFQNIIRDSHLFDSGDRILLAVSGGVDSMVLWNLFEESGNIYAVIHCNFQLRGKDSDEDESLVRNRAEELGIQLFVKRFDTREYADASGISIEMAARELRYAWFEEIRLKHAFRYLATAHHQDDLLETFFINLVRKTGIRGLTGFREKSGTLIRPLLYTNRVEIEAWAEKKNIPFRKDSTNEETVFQRNFIRHNIIPQLERLNPAFRSNLAGTMENLRRTEEFYFTEINRYINRISNKESENPEILISQLLKLPHPETVLYEWMSRFGFNASTVESLYANLVKEPGRQYFSKTHRLVTDRNKLIITALREEGQQVFYIPVNLSIERKKASEFELIRDPVVACLDAGKLVFPLVIRKWHAGEYFQPLGMSGFKKISDFYIDEKFSLPEKETTWILYSDNKVVWIIGRRIDNRFRITPETKEVLVMRIE